MHVCSLFPYLFKDGVLCDCGCDERERKESSGRSGKLSLGDIKRHILMEDCLLFHQLVKSSKDLELKRRKKIFHKHKPICGQGTALLVSS